MKYRTPVILLSDGYIANGSEPWCLPDIASLPDISVPFATEMNHTNEDGTQEFWPYLRDPETLARPWAIPGTPQLMHRVGGLEKEDGRGDINYTPENHQRMVFLRAAKIAGIANDIPPAVAVGDVDDADICVLGWGSTWAAIDAAVQRTRRRGLKVAWVHLTHLNPLPPEPRRHAAALPATDRARAQPRSAVPHRSRRVPGRRQAGHQGAGPALHGTRTGRCHRRSIEMSDTLVPVTTKKDWTSDQEVRWCPGLR